VRILLPAREAGSGGLGSSIRGLAAHVPKALPPGDELVVLGGDGQPDGNWLRPSRRVTRFLHEQLVVSRAARGVDLVHLPDHRPLLASRTPFLLTVYDLLYIDRPEWFPPAVARYKALMLRAALAKRPALVVTGSEYTRARFLARFPDFPAERVRTIHPGIWPADPVPDPRPGDYFLTVSTIEPRKNHLGVLRALRAARKRGFELRWKIAGALGYAAAPIVTELKGEPGVDVLGWIPDEELDDLYRGARFAVYPSFAEGFGLPPLEAMARGIPVACSAGSALDESVCEAALRVDPRDTAAWAEALVELQSDAGHLRARGLERAASFTWERAAAAYVEAYGDALRA
jgi:glycosyltransferase involved in cell wall biosynthesis